LTNSTGKRHGVSASTTNASSSLVMRLDRVLDDVYVLICAVDDLAADLGTSGVDMSEVGIHVQGLVAATSPLRSALRP
jgi:hypothetical protein